MYPNSRIRFRVACPRDFGKSYQMELDVAMAPGWRHLLWSLQRL